MKLNVPYQTLAFTLFKKCNASCSMCCFECNPQSKEVLDVGRIKEYIDESKEIDDIKTISFTGGEPFLKYNLLLELVSYAANCNKRVTTISNGFWASTYDKAIKKLSELQKSGLQHISVSHDAYHRNYIKTEYVANLLKAASDLGLPSTLALVKMKGEEIGDIINELGSSLYATALEIVPCLPAGGAKKNFAYENFDRTIPTNAKGLRCIYSGNIVVGFDGKIYPCCSQMVFETGLAIGSYEELSLKNALLKTKKNGLLHLLRNSELSTFVEFAREKLDLNIPDMLVNPCELCALLFKKEQLTKYAEFVNNKVQH